MKPIELLLVLVLVVVMSAMAVSTFLQCAKASRIQPVTDTECQCWDSAKGDKTAYFDCLAVRGAK